MNVLLHGRNVSGFSSKASRKHNSVIFAAATAVILFALLPLSVFGAASEQELARLGWTVSDYNTYISVYGVPENICDVLGYTDFVPSDDELSQTKELLLNGEYPFPEGFTFTDGGTLAAGAPPSGELTDPNPPPVTTVPHNTPNITLSPDDDTLEKSFDPILVPVVTGALLLLAVLLLTGAAHIRHRRQKKEDAEFAAFYDDTELK